MKKLFFFAFVACMIASCTKSDLSVSEKTPDQAPIQPELVKTIDYDNPATGVKAKIDIYNAAYSNVTERDFKFIPNNVDLGLLQENSDNAELDLEESDDSKELQDMVITIIEIPTGFNAIKFESDFADVSRGIPALVQVFNGRSGTCGVDGLRIRGFEGFPQNCNHCHWKWSKKTASSNWFWQQLYNAKSTNSSTFIGYLDLASDYPEFRLRRDPDKNCNAYPAVNIIITSC